MLRLENIKMSYGERTLFDGLSCSLEENKIITISGNSGCGKSTLLGIMSGLLKPDSGSVYYTDKNIFKWNDFQRASFRNREIGFVFQFFSLFDDMTAYENIVMPSLINLSKSRKMGKEELHELIGKLKIESILKSYPSTLSGGERQRVAIARSVINKPRVILADEPTGNLDSSNTMEIVNLFKYFRDHYGTTIIIVTHDPFLVKNSDVRYKLEDGILEREEVKKSSAAGKPAVKKVGSSKKTAAKKKAAKKSTVKGTAKKK